MFPRGASPYGALDMSGTVFEWTYDRFQEEWYRNSPYANPVNPPVADNSLLVIRGGSYRDASKDLRCDARVLPLPAWNQSDPNLPRSVWWLADAPFVGFRIACEGEPDADGAPRPAPAGK